jgi:hypothetical protein
LRCTRWGHRRWPHPYGPRSRTLYGVSPLVADSRERALFLDAHWDELAIVVIHRQVSRIFVRRMFITQAQVAH